MLTIVRRPIFLLFIFNFLFLITLSSSSANAQNSKPKDTTVVAVEPTGKATTVTAIEVNAKGDTVAKKVRVYSPGQAALRSAILPGLGQIYNKKYWKLPIVYGALGISGSIFVFNLKWYKRTRYAYKVLVARDTPNFVNVHKDLQLFIKRGDANSLSYARDEYRRRIDYSVLFFVIMWGLNVVDAAVDAHLKAFDVSPDLSLQFKPGHSDMAGTNGMSLVLNFRKRKPDLLPSQF
jgi:hypothetical protein